MQNRVRIEMSVCHIKKGDFDSAEGLLKAASSNQAAEATMERAMFLLGDIAFYRGNLDSAGETYKQMVKLYPQGDFTNDALMRLDILAMAGRTRKARPIWVVSPERFKPRCLETTSGRA